MIDTHCHINYPDFKDDLVEVLKRAKESGVSKIITISLNKETTQENFEIVNQHKDFVYTTVGVHPSEVSKIPEDDIFWIEAMAGERSVVAIGEIGLDIYRGETNLKEQEAVFTRLLELSIQLALPVVIHHRAAGLRTFEIIKHYDIHRGVFHCFSEDYDYAKKVLDQGLHISFTGNITYKNSTLPDLAKKIPLNRTMLETDAPFMSPVPYRGRRCEPSYVKEIAYKLADVHQVTFDHVNKVTTQTAEELFFSDSER